ATWSPWAPLAESASGAHVASPAARFIQYRVRLTGGAASPVLRQVVISYLPRNQAPKLALTAPAAGEFWRATPQIKWNGSDPDKDTLTYEAYFSGDNGKTWKRIGERVQPPTPSGPSRSPRSGQPKHADPKAVSQAVATDPVLARFREDLAASPELTDEDRQQA